MIVMQAYLLTAAFSIRGYTYIIPHSNMKVTYEDYECHQAPQTMGYLRSKSSPNYEDLGFGIQK